MTGDGGNTEPLELRVNRPDDFGTGGRGEPELPTIIYDEP